MPNPICITLNHIKKHKPCTEGWKNLLDAKGGRKSNLNEFFPLRAILDANVNGEGLEDTIWCFRCLPEYEDRFLKFVTFCKKTACDLLEKEEMQECVKEVGRYLTGDLALEDLRDVYDRATEAIDKAANVANDTSYDPTNVVFISEEAQTVAFTTTYRAVQRNPYTSTRRELDTGYTASTVAADKAEKAERQKQIEYLRKLLNGEV